MTTQQLLTVPELAAVLRVNKFTVYRWAKRGKLPAVVLPSGQVRFDLAAVRASLAAGGGHA